MRIGRSPRGGVPPTAKGPTSSVRTRDQPIESWSALALPEPGQADRSITSCSPTLPASAHGGSGSAWGSPGWGLVGWVASKPPMIRQRGVRGGHAASTVARDPPLQPAIGQRREDRHFGAPPTRRWPTRAWCLSSRSGRSSRPSGGPFLPAQRSSGLSSAPAGWPRPDSPHPEDHAAKTAQAPTRPNPMRKIAIVRTNTATSDASRSVLSRRWVDLPDAAGCRSRVSSGSPSWSTERGAEGGGGPSERSYAARRCGSPRMDHASLIIAMSPAAFDPATSGWVLLAHAR